jgi:single-strand DNA-binding protein
MQNLFIDEGNLGADPVLKYVSVNTANGSEQRAVMELQVRFDVRKKRGDVYEDVGGFWARVTQWGKRAELNHQFLVKGCRVLVVGELSQHAYIIQKGERMGQPDDALDIDAEHIALVLLGIDEIVYQEKMEKIEKIEKIEKNEREETIDTREKQGVPEKQMKPKKPSRADEVTTLDDIPQS